MDSFHPDAAKNFDSRALSLLAKIAPSKIRVRSPSFSPDLHVKAHLKSTDIVGIESAVVDGFGDEVARYFFEGKTAVGLLGDAYQEFADLARAIQRTDALASKVSGKVVQSLMFEWLKQSRRLANTDSLSIYLIRECQKIVKEYEVCAPIAMLSIESPFTIGKVELRPLTESVLDAWQAEQMEGSADPRQAEDVAALFSMMREKMQGYTAAFLTITAEPQRAQEIALEEATIATSLLRFCSPASISPKLSCYCVPLGREHNEGYESLVFHDGHFTSWSRGNVDLGFETWVLSNEEISKHQSEFLAPLSQLYVNPRSKFKQRILDSILMYSRVSISHDPAQKLVYLLAAVESVLLKNSTEPISQNLAERMAILSGTSLDDKKHIIKTTKSTYELRSKFLHHAREFDDLELLSEFMFLAWRALTLILSNRDQFATTEEFLDKIDESKLT